MSDETSKAILDIENKKKAIIQASNAEQNTIKSKINDEYRNIGETSYALYNEGNLEIEKITDMFQTVKELHQTLDEKQTKLDEILGRYDEELSILRPAAAAAAPITPAGQGQCPSCGMTYIPGEMLFCNKCGSKLPEQTGSGSESITIDVNRAFCNKCGGEYSPGSDKFCIGCGNKIG